jgi:hypothetical protein
VSASDARGQVIGTIRANEFLQGGRLTDVSLRRAEEERQRFANIFDQAGNDITSVIAAVEGRLAQRREVAAESIGASNFERAAEIRRARKDQAELEAVLRRLRLIQQSGTDTAALSALSAANTVGGTVEATSRSAAASGVADGVISSALSEIADSLNQRLQRLGEARASGDLELVASLEESIGGLQVYADELASAASATVAFSDTLKRVATDLANTVAGEAKSAAESARRQANAASTNPLASPEDRRIAQRRRIEAEQQASRASRAAQRLEEDRIAAVQQFERDAAAGNLGNEVQALIDERRRLREEAAAEGTTIERRQQIEARQRQIDAELSSRFERSDRGRELRRRADRLDASSTQERARLDSAARGEDLIQSSADQAARQLSQSLLDIREAFDLRRREGLADNANEQAQAEQRLRDDTFRQVAPAIFALADQSANAVLQGPSRARLAASDITTQSGTDELNRLLRGDDSARQQNLVELRKQTQELEKVNTNLRALGVA